MLEKYEPVFEKFKDYTMVAREPYLLNLFIADRARVVPGAIVECGTWKGGMIAGMASILGNSREYILFDSFEGLPPAREIDGKSAIEWQADTESPFYFDNCKAAEADADAAMQLSGVENYRIVKGWFEETLLSFSGEEIISVLRLDGDWYDSTMTCLEYLFPKVSTGGVIIIDDYYEWDGCARAVHDYLSKEKRSERIFQLFNDVCYIMKK